MREITNLAWPMAPYSTAHRPVQRPLHLVTGIAIQPPRANTGPAGYWSGWAVAHIPVHRTHPSHPGLLRYGVHAALAHPGTRAQEAACWSVLDQILTAGRRQAAALCGVDLAHDLAAVVDRQQAAGRGLQAAGTAILLAEWPAASTAAPRAGRARLVDLAEAPAGSPSAALLGRYPPFVPDRAAGAPGMSDPAVLLARLVLRAAAVAVAGGVAIDLVLGAACAGLDLRAALDEEAGDLVRVDQLDGGSSGLPATTAG